MKNDLITIIILATLVFANAFADDVTTTTTITNSSGNLNNNDETKPTQTITHSTTTTITPSNDLDDNIVTAIYAKYKHDAALIATSLSVSSQNGIVTITGNVTAQAQADEAVIVARGIKGVRDVHSFIHVTTNPHVNDTQTRPNY